MTTQRTIDAAGEISATKTKLLAREVQRSAPPAFAYLSLFLLGLFVAAGIQNIRDSLVRLNQRELVRTSSSDHKLEAVFVTPVIAAFGHGSSVCLVPKGDPAPPWGCVLTGNSFDTPPSLLWQQPRVLTIAFAHGCIDAFSNQWRSNDIDTAGETVEVRLAEPLHFACVGSQPEHAAAQVAEVTAMRVTR